MFIRKPKPKSFDYQPRYYDPEKDQEEKRKRQLGFRNVKRNAKRKRSSLFIIIIFVIILYLYLTFSGV